MLVRTPAQAEALANLNAAREELRGMHADTSMSETNKQNIMRNFEKAVNRCWDAGCTPSQVLDRYLEVEKGIWRKTS